MTSDRTMVQQEQIAGAPRDNPALVKRDLHFSFDLFPHYGDDGLHGDGPAAELRAAALAETNP